MDFRRVLLMRHAMSSHDAPSDSERPLTPQGRYDAQRISSEIHSHGWIPDRIVVSNSKRTLQTVEMLSECKGVSKDSREDLYLASTETISEYIESTQPTETLLIVTHNPGCELVLYQLTGVYHEMSPGSCAMLSDSKGKWICQQVLNPGG